MKTSGRACRQTGFSLVELMVAMVVSLILLAGILQILLGNRQSFDSQKALSGMQQDSRLASFVLEYGIAHAGYRVELEPELKYVFPDGYITAKDGGGTDPDTIGIRFQASGGVYDCGGDEIGENGPEKTYFQVTVDVDNVLRCRVMDSTNNVISTWPLIDNVETLQVRYGLDTDDDNAVDSYSNTLTASTSLDVRSVRIQLLLISETNALPSKVAQKFTFADGNTMTFDDRRARQLVDQTVALRNVLP